MMILKFAGQAVQLMKWQEYFAGLLNEDQP